MEANQKHKTDLCGCHALMTYQGYISLMFEGLINPMLEGSISLIIKELISPILGGRISLYVIIILYKG